MDEYLERHPELVKVGYEQDYPGSYKWPIYQLICPLCKQQTNNYGTTEQEIDGRWQYICDECAEKEIKEMGDK